MLYYECLNYNQWAHTRSELRLVKALVFGIVPPLVVTGPDLNQILNHVVNHILLQVAGAVLVHSAGD